MTVLDKPRNHVETEPLFLSEEKMDALRAIVAQQFKDFGIEYDPSATAEDAQKAMLADGVRPEDNFLSRAIVAAREE